MNAQSSNSVICMMLMVSPALAGFGDNGSPRRVVDSCHAQITELVGYLKQTAELEGAALRVEHSGNRARLNYPDFAQHLQCVDGELHIHFGEPDFE